ncbi:HD domain-containing protein [Mesoflavibacter sp. CH_XMU1422-2]|uniref:HD domain-containing protein n=1 Tax=Mesoflavibacter sp. CH_XMU1422-2 TaxID=3107770 RepID=UPI00300BCCFB
MIDWLKNEWIALASNYSSDKDLIYNYWEDIKSQYSKKSRYYHNLEHIHNMLVQLETIKNEIANLPEIKFAIWYHDIIYKSTKKDNEEKSAAFAKNRLKSFNFSLNSIKKVEELILSTKKHNVILNQNQDNAYLLDLDLSILGSNWETYKNYTQQIRKEYKIYPDFMYKSGRKKVLQHFLERDTLYFTKTYKIQFENKARENIKRELETL